MLATVQSIALHTLRGAGSMEEARKALTDRLIALAKVHDVLTRESWEGAELYDLIAGVTSPHAGGNRFVINGPPVWLTPALSLSIALALHELVTNAVKYGALSAECGSVTISWEVTDPHGHPRLTLRWVERGGPPVRTPTRLGFGSRLIERSLSAESGTATIDYASEGLVCLMETPLRGQAAPVETTPAE
jgi:two-component sensor histidine kinase